MNTDYKILTKTLTTYLGDIAPQLLDEPQAGFVKGRQITHQTKLARLMIRYAEKTGENSAILSLDQEKLKVRVRQGQKGLTEF